MISVGESLPWLNGYKFRKYNEITVDESDENIEIIDIHPKHRHRNPNLHWNTTIDTIMKVNNLEDDGIDELSEQLPKILILSIKNTSRRAETPRFLSIAELV